MGDGEGSTGARFRVDLVSGASALIASGRGDRPRSTLAHQGTIGTFADRHQPIDPECDFCPGNEASTGHELARRCPPGSSAWSLRVVENRFPVVSRGSGDDLAGEAELIILGPRHDQRIEDMKLAHVTAILEVIWARTIVLMTSHASVQVYVNEGFGAGASMSHPHGQLIALDVMTPWVLRELAQVQGSVDPLAVDAQRARDEGLMVHDGRGIASWTPWGSPFPGMVRIAGRDPVPFHDVDSMLLAELAGEIQRVLQTMNRAFGAGAYNVLIHHDVVRDGARRRWRVEVVPRFVALGGFELLSGIAAHDDDPSRTAEALRVARVG